METLQLIQRGQLSVQPDVRRSRHLSMARVTSELHRLCRNGDLSAIRSYLNETITSAVINKVTGENGCTPLHEAAMAGREDVIQLLKEESQEALDIDPRTHRGPASTPLHLAAERGHVECVITLMEYGASMQAVDRRCRNAKDVAKENGKRQVVHVITLYEMELAAKNSDVEKLKEIVTQLQSQTRLSDTVRRLQQEKLNQALLKASRGGNYKIVIPLVEAGANNFEDCITGMIRLNHILAYLRLCQAAHQNDRTAIQLLLEQDETEILGHKRYPTLMQYRQILMPLLENGKFTVGTPIRVALRAGHVLAAGHILLRFSKHPSSGMVDWHGLELDSIPEAWVRAIEYPNLNFASFSFNKLKQIPFEITKFTNLVKFQVSSNSICFVPSEILQLPRLEHLDLSYNCIEALPEALLGPVSKVLSTLNLSHNKLSSLPIYFEESPISDLDLSHNHFSKVPECVCNFDRLESLNLSYNIQICLVPYEIGHLKHMKVLSLDGLTYLLNIPPRQEWGPLDFLQKRYKSMQTIPHFEIQIVGFPESNKMVTLLSDTFSSSKLTCSVLHYSNPTQFLYLHSVFQLSSTLYIIIWNCHSKQHPNDIHHVLRHLAVYAPDAPVVIAACWKKVVTPEMEKATKESVAQSLWSDLSDKVHIRHIQIGHVEADDIHSLKSLTQTVENLSKSVQTTFFVPNTYYNYTKFIPIACQERLENEVKPPMWKQIEFSSLICSMPSHDISSNKELTELLDFLIKKGCLLHIPSNHTRSQSLYVCDRQWFCNVLGHAVSHTGDTLGYRNFTGIVRQDGLIDLLDSPTFVEHEIPPPLSVFVNHHGIAIAFSSTQWLVPSMLDAKPDPSVHGFLSQFGVRRQYTFTLTPITFWGRLITHLLINQENYSREICCKDMASDAVEDPTLDWSYWATGMIGWVNGTELLYCIEAIKTQAEPFVEGFEIRVPNTPKGSHMMEALTYTVESLLRNWYPTLWKSVEIWVPCSFCIYRGTLDIPSISFSDALEAASKKVGVQCSNHPNKAVSIAKIIPDLFQHEVTADFFIPPGKVEFNSSNKSSCISPPNSETVFKGKYNDQLVAVKLYPHIVPNKANSNVDCSKSSSLAMLEMWQECQALRHIRSSSCPYLVSLLGIGRDPLCLVFPFAKWTSFEEVIQDKELFIPLIVRIKMVYQLTCALRAIHSRHIIHRHLCLANILVTSLHPDDEVNIKLAGFSEACHTMFQGVGKGYHGKFPAPEMSKQVSSDYDERVDMFAFAFVAYEILTRRKIPTNCQVALFQVQFHPVRPTLAPIRARMPYFARQIEKCWDVDPNKRPFASNLLEHFTDPLHILTRDGQVIAKKHGFFAGAAKFTRTKHGFNADIFLCSGALSGETTVTLTQLSMPGLHRKSVTTFPTEYIISMCCIGNQLWVSTYGKKVLVYSTPGLAFKSEFVFNHHVVAMAVSPTQVYLGLENGVLQVYDVSTNIVPTEPFLTKVVCQGQDIKCIEPLEDCVMCASRDNIYRLQPDILHAECKWPIVSESEIRNIIMTQFVGTEDLVWVSFRRLDRIEVRSADSGEYKYEIDCSSVVEMKSTEVWVVTMQVVLDTVWVGLNTGHILIFSSTSSRPSLITHFKIHEGNVRQLLLLHPSYMGPASIQVTNESLPRSASPLSTPSPHADQVYVLSCGEGLSSSLPTLADNGTLFPESDNTDTNKEDLYAVILEGIYENRLTAIDRNCGRPTVAYSVPDEDYYSVPPPVENPYELTNLAYRTSTWSARTQHSPVITIMREISRPFEDDPQEMYESLSHVHQKLQEIDTQSSTPEATPESSPSHTQVSNESTPTSISLSVPPPLPPRSSTSKKPVLHPPSTSTRRMPCILEREDSSEPETPTSEHQTKKPATDHSETNEMRTDRSHTVPNQVEAQSKESHRTPTDPRCFADSCEDENYDPYVSMYSIMQGLKTTAPPEWPLGSRTASCPSREPQQQEKKQTPPPLPPRKLANSKGMLPPPLPPKDTESDVEDFEMIGSSEYENKPR